MSDPILSDIDYKNKMAWVWATLEFLLILSKNGLSRFLGYSKIRILGCVYGPFAKFGVLGSLYSLYQQINGFCFYG